MINETVRTKHFNIDVRYEFVADWDNIYGGYIEATIAHPAGNPVVVAGQTLPEARKQVALVLEDIDQ